MEHLLAVVKRTERCSADVVTIFFTLQKGGVLEYVAGQYITVFFDGSSTAEGKAYSLASAPSEKQMSIVVKKVGEFSGLLHALRAGDTFQISRAYGFFNPLTSKPLVCISAGVGVAPIWSVLKHEYQHDVSRIAHLFYSNKTTKDIVFADEIDAQSSRHNMFSVHQHITRQPGVPSHMHSGRIDLDSCVGIIEDAVYMVCGSADFVRSMWQGLVARGISTERISTETFFES